MTYEIIGWMVLSVAIVAWIIVGTEPWRDMHVDPKHYKGDRL